MIRRLASRLRYAFSDITKRSTDIKQPDDTDNITAKRNQKFKDQEISVKDWIDGKKDISQVVDEMSKPIDIYVNKDHELMIDSPLHNKETYTPLVVDQFNEHKQDMLRIKDNQLVSEILHTGKMNISDERIKVKTVNQTDLQLIGNGRYCII